MLRLYFAHPISSYGSDEENIIISKLSQGFEVVNPSDEVHQSKVKALREEFNDRSKSSKAIMDYFVEVCNSCDVCAVLPFPTGELGAGTVKEAQSFVERDAGIYKIVFDGGVPSLETIEDLSKEKCLDVENTRKMLKIYMPSYGA